VEGRPTLGHAPWDDYEAESSLCASWYRFDDPPRGDDGTWDPLALVTLCDTMPGAVGERLEQVAACFAEEDQQPEDQQNCQQIPPAEKPRPVAHRTGDKHAHVLTPGCHIIVA